MDVHHGGGEIQGDVKILQALDNVALQSAGVGEDLRHCVDLGALQGHAPGHNKPDVAASEDHHIFSGHKALHIHQALGGTGGIDTRRTVAGDVQRAPGPLPAAHGQNHRLGLDLNEPRLRSGDGKHPVLGKIQHHGAQQIGNVHLLHPVNESPGVLGARQLLAEGVQTEACVDALVEDAPQLLVPLDNEDVLHALFPGSDSGSQTRRASADDGKLYLFHACTSLV